MEPLSEELSSLSINDKGAQSHVHCKKFGHVNLTAYPKQAFHFFKESREIGTITHRYDDERYIINDKSGLPRLNSDICEYKKDRNKNKIRKYLGHNMTTGFESFEPLPLAVLEDMRGVFLFMERFEAKNGTKFNQNNKFTIVSARHHLIDLIMCPFSKEDVSLVVTYVDGYLYFSPDSRRAKKDTGIHSKSTHMRRICYTGFELENLVTQPLAENQRSCFFSMIEGKINDNIGVLLKAEMDCHDDFHETYTEIKCSTDFKLNNQHHRRKLLRMWVQTSLVPQTDLLIGFRDPYYNQLSALQSYTRNQLYHKFNNKNMKVDRMHLNYNANISVQWFHHLIEQLCDLVENNIKDNRQQSFRVMLSKELCLSIEALSKTPKGAIP
ncbi:LAFE_0F03334g1_1 [Lachancea fermentati]|uniref:Decapping nuclease n=1 Tax=Lachancea fermentati TaxID=4955 RepID=A0A1G4MEL6_LACFM|nr:LAFE_0F03334g1_1 [Lachancea fermentati]